MKNNELFKYLIKEYFAGNFEEKVNDLLEKCTENKINLANKVSALCGVEVKYNEESFAQDLKTAIKNYSTSNKVILRVDSCEMNCCISDGKTQCQVACPFNAVVQDLEHHTTFVDVNKCTDCGFCIEACPNGNYIDKTEFLPLSNLL